MKKLQSVNPANGRVEAEYECLSDDEVTAKIDLAHATYLSWKKSSQAERAKMLTRVAKLLRANQTEYAHIIVKEVGKRLEEAMAEVEKCAIVCTYYAENTKYFLQAEHIKTEAKESYIRYEPLGVVLAVMPWNFPFWQVFRAACPALMAGNTMVLKHASSVCGSALKIEEIFALAGSAKGVFQALLIESKKVERIIENPLIRMISLTGSEEAGASVASIAGKNIKKVVLELGGSDPFIVLPDADIDKAAQVAATARLIVAGQSCIAAKRFIVHKDVATEFTEKFKTALTQKKIGDPLDPSSGVGPLSSQRAVEAIDEQVKQSVAMGAKILLGGKRVDGPGFFYEPTILTNVTQDMPVFRQETFGPLAALMVVNDSRQALEVANNSRYGLGASVWTASRKLAQPFIENLESGCVFINSMVKSDPRLPFGGSKFSGFGRELSELGLKEFTHVKTVWYD